MMATLLDLTPEIVWELHSVPECVRVYREPPRFAGAEGIYTILSIY